LAFKYIISLIIVASVAAMILLFSDQEQAPIRVGVLHSLTGTMAISEKPVVDATLLAIEQINNSGGLLGRRIEAVVVDGKSDWPTFAREAERLIVEEKVSVIFGCWTSASRKYVKRVVEKYNHLLFYPVQYEGLEQSPNVIYTGATPNQQIAPAVHWAMENLGKRVYLIGSDYVFPRVANWLIRKQVKLLGGTVVGESYLLLGDTDVETVVSDIEKLQPDVIFNTINGDTNSAFFHAFDKSGLDATTHPVMSFSVGESELAQMNGDNIMVSHYAAWSYFQNIDNDENRMFVRDFQQLYGKERVLSDPMEAAWMGVKLWASAVTSAETDNTQVITETVLHRSMKAPEGIVSIDQTTQHTWKMARIGKILQNGQFDIRWTSNGPIRPEPFPSYVTKFEAKSYLEALKHSWNGRWAASGQVK